MDKLQQLVKDCKSSVHLEFNLHTVDYMSAAEWIDREIENMDNHDGSDSEDLKRHRDKMIETDSIIELQFYPDTPIGSYTIYHYDLDMALDEALDILRRRREDRQRRAEARMPVILTSKDILD